MAEQQVQVAPHDATVVLQASKPAHLVSRKYKGCLHFVNLTFSDGVAKFHGGEVATLLKDVWSLKKGINLTSLRIVILPTTKNAGFAFTFSSAAESIKSFEDIVFSPNSIVYLFPAPTTSSRTILETTMPTGLGRQLVPCDPNYPAPHMFYATQKDFKGTVQFIFEYECDVLISVSTGFQ